MAELIDFGSKITYSNESPMRWGSEQAISGANKIRDFNRQRAVENAVSKNYDPKTLKIDENGIAQDLASKGFGGTAEQVINQLKAERTKMSSDVADAIGKDYNLIGMKIMSPQRFIEKWGNSTEATAMVDELKSQIAKTDTAKQSTQPVSDIPVQTVSEPPVKKTALDDLKQRFPNSFKFTPKDATFDTYVETPPSENVVSVGADEFTSKMPEGKLEDIIPETKYEVKTNKPTTTTQYLAIDTTPEKLASMFPDVSNNPQDIASSTFSSKGMRQDEKDNATRFLARAGYVEPGDTLEDSVARYENAKIAAVQRPVPPQPGKNPVEERARYAKERSEYQAKEADAINAARKEMRGGYAEVQGTTLAAQGGELAKRADARAAEAEKRAKEDQEYRLAKQKNDIFVRKVSEPEAEKVYKITDEYEDIAEAAINPTFESAWGAAVSLAKIDGNVTLDNVTNYLIGMKAFPPRSIAELKRELGPSVDWYDRASERGLEAWRDIAGTVSKTAGSARGADPAYIKRQLDKWNKVVIKNGGKKMPTDFNTTSSSGSTTSTTPASTEPQKSGAKAQADKIQADARAKAAAKKGATPPKPDSPW